MWGIRLKRMVMMTSPMQYLKKKEISGTMCVSATVPSRPTGSATRTTTHHDNAKLHGPTPASIA